MKYVLIVRDCETAEILGEGPMRDVKLWPSDREIPEGWEKVELEKDEALEGQ